MVIGLKQLEYHFQYGVYTGHTLVGKSSTSFTEFVLVRTFIFTDKVLNLCTGHHGINVWHISRDISPNNLTDSRTL